MNELISVIVSVFNIEDYLPQCLACIEMQTYRNLEIILVDDGSTDGSGKICDEFAAKDPRARVIHHPENKGLWAARNTGQDAATGDYLWFPDGDDYFHKDIIKVMYDAINKTSSSGKSFDLAMVKYKKTSCVDEDISSEIAPSFVEMPLNDVLDTFVRRKNHFSAFSVPFKLCRKKLTEGIRTGEYKCAEDVDFSLKLYLKNPTIVCVDNLLYYYVSRSSSITHSSDWILDSTHLSVQILYNGFLSNQPCRNCCQRYILESIYITIAKLLDCVQGTDSLTDIRRECRQIISHTWRYYLKCDAINTPMKRMGRLLRVRFDSLYRLLQYIK